MKKPVVHYKGNPSFSSGFAFLVAIDHPRFPANFPVRTSLEVSGLSGFLRSSARLMGWASGL